MFSNYYIIIAYTTYISRLSKLGRFFKRREWLKIFIVYCLLGKNPLMLGIPGDTLANFIPVGNDGWVWNWCVERDREREREREVCGRSMLTVCSLPREDRASCISVYLNVRITIQAGTLCNVDTRVSREWYIWHRWIAYVTESFGVHYYKHENSQGTWYWE